jgi:uncharacterized protein YjiS (DUF1127 family)
MLMSATAGRIPIGAGNGLADVFARAIAAVRRHIAAAREARALLLGMTDRELRDIGLTRYELVRLYEDGRP